MKKGAAIIFISIWIGLLLAGCAGEKNQYELDKEKPVELRLWHYYNGAQAIAFEDLVQEFNATVGMEQGIIVVSESKGSIEDLAKALEESADKKVGAQKMPNILQCYLDVAAGLDEKGLLADLDQYITPEEKAEFIDSYVEEGCSFKDGKWKLFPVAKANELLVVNKTVWDKFAAETDAEEKKLSTWEGIAELGEEYYRWSGGMSFFGRDAFANYLIVGSMQLGTELISVKDGEVSLQFEKEIMKKLWDNYYVPYVKGYYNHTGRYRSDDMKTGTIIASVGSTSGISFFSDRVTVNDQESYPVEYMVLPVPDFAGTKSHVAQQGASMAVAKGTDKEEYASTVFLKWFAEEEQNIPFAVNSGYLPVKEGANELNKIEAYIKKEGIQLKPIQEAAIEASNHQVLNSHLYITRGFEGGNAARNILNTTMTELAAADAQNIKEKTEQGMSQEEALQPYLTEEHFEQWYEDTKEQLNEVCGE